MRKRSFLRLGLALLLAMSTLLSSAVGAFAAAGDPDTPEEPSGGGAGEAQPATLTITFSGTGYTTDPQESLTAVVDPDTWDVSKNLKENQYSQTGGTTAPEGITFVYTADQHGENGVGTTPGAWDGTNIKKIVITQELAKKYPGGIILKGTTDCCRIDVLDGVTVKLILDGVNINTSTARMWRTGKIWDGQPGEYILCNSEESFIPYPTDRVIYSPITIGKNATVTIELAAGTQNTLSTSCFPNATEKNELFTRIMVDPAIHFFSGSLTITGSGTLNAEQGTTAIVNDTTHISPAVIGSLADEPMTGAITIGDEAKVSISSGFPSAVGIGAGSGSGEQPDLDTAEDMLTGSVTIQGDAQVTIENVSTGIGTGSYGNVTGDITVKDSAQVNITLKEGATGAAIGSGKGGSMNGSITLGNVSEGEKQPNVTIHDTGVIGPKGEDGTITIVDGVLIGGSVEELEPEEPGETPSTGGPFTEPEYYPDYEEDGENLLPPEEEEQTPRYRVTCRTLNVRSGPETSYSKAGTLSRGAVVEGEVEDGWLRFDYNGQTAYCSAEYLLRADGDALHVLCRTLNVRSGPGTNYSKIGTLSRGAQVEVQEELDGWYKIATLSGAGYVSAEYVG